MSSMEPPDGITRRELVGGIVALSLLSTVGTSSQSVSAQASVEPAHYEALRKTLIERLVNTRYYSAPDGSIHVLPHDEVWPGESGGAYHADWLSNGLTGLKTNPRIALEDTVIADAVHEGVPSGCDVSLVRQILDNAATLGLLDDAGLIYQVFREKISSETVGAHTYGVHQFHEWTLANPDLTKEQRDVIDSAVVSYLDVARPHHSHTWY